MIFDMVLAFFKKGKMREVRFADGINPSVGLKLGCKEIFNVPFTSCNIKGEPTG